jgi:hypothetical protein
VKTSLILLDACLPDYFQGCSPDRGIVLAVPVFREMTKQTFIDSLHDEWRSDDGSDERFESVTDDDFREAIAELTANTPDDDKGLFPHAPSQDDETSDSVYCYILVTAPEAVSP